jgi:hypothetical protein
MYSSQETGDDMKPKEKFSRTDAVPVERTENGYGPQA